MRLARAIDEAFFSTNHPNVAKEALPLWRRALELFSVSLGADHPNTTTVQKWLDDYLE